MAVVGKGRRQQLDVGTGLGEVGVLWNFPSAAVQVRLFFIPMTTSPSCPLLASSCFGARAAGRTTLFIWRMWSGGSLTYLYPAGPAHATQTKVLF